MARASRWCTTTRPSFPGFVDMGIPVEEARGYSNDGCWETLDPRQEPFQLRPRRKPAVPGSGSWAGPELPRQCRNGLDSGDPETSSPGSNYQAYRRQTEARIDFHCRRRLENLGLSSMIAPDPLMSALTRDCIRKGRDLTQGGRAIFSTSSWSRAWPISWIPSP